MLSLIRNTYNDNFEAQEAIRLIAFTNQSLFLTGKAGAGKSYLLQKITEHTRKKFVILASTGVAALNVGGQTIHSFFQIEPRPYLPNNKGIKELGLEKRTLLSKLDLIIIDEVSMVRCDLLQAIDLSLRKNLRSNLPFAGKQLLLIGDLFQLPPVLDSRKHEETSVIENNYQTRYFFSAASFSEGYNIQIIELLKSYRQRDTKFIDVLNAVRDNKVSSQDLEEINKRFSPDYQPKDTVFEITLTTTNALADDTNTTRLQALGGAAKEYRANATGEFVKDMSSDNKLPAPKVLVLKPASQVMFIKNDKDRRWVNGSLGKIMALENNRLRVKLDNGGSEYYVDPVQWEKVEFKWNKETEEIEKIVTGTFTQFPLKLAWAVTIHKSQGQTFDNVIVDLGKGAFETGQTYVALSRCRTIEGIKLRKPISRTDIAHDQKIKDYLDSKQNSNMERERYESILGGLQDHVARMEPEIDRLKAKVREGDAARAELANKNAAIEKLQKEIAQLKATIAQLKEAEGKQRLWRMAMIAAIVVLGYLLYLAKQ